MNDYFIVYRCYQPVYYIYQPIHRFVYCYCYLFPVDSCSVCIVYCYHIEYIINVFINEIHTSVLSAFL
ncbi:hypothetical protein BDB01DRAFT_769470 [Pilobolus umbonatus]|nr:hypothetical protein BDB01DRAFT_769470 [Pilobolus umbonatus]